MSKVKVAKFAINVAIQTVVAGMVGDKIKEHVDAETTTQQVGVAVAAGVAGYIVADYASSRIIDPQIDKIAAWYAARKTEKTPE